MIFKDIAQSMKDKLPFVAYRKPNSNLLNALFQKHPEIHYSNDYSESGFIFAPFDSQNRSVLIPMYASNFVQEELFIEDNKKLKPMFVNSVDTTSKDAHMQLVKKAIEAIDEHQFKKVVISRKEEVSLKRFKCAKVFRQLLQQYPNAFVYVWYHPTIGLWLGASPETLLNVRGQKFETMALAGTQLFNGTTKVVWQQKELDEQQFVTDYIEEKISKIAKRIKKSKVETVKAGSLLHLKTTLKGKFKDQDLTLKALIDALHPTPAVCGLPKEAATHFILENETYVRSFYTGFMGELNIDNPSDKLCYSELYVNLRCMQIKNQMATVYIGGGITKDSDPSAEWEETVAKSTIVKRVLKIKKPLS